MSFEKFNFKKIPASIWLNQLKFRKWKFSKTVRYPDFSALKICNIFLQSHLKV